MNDLGQAVIGLVILGMLFVFTIWFGVWLFTDKVVKSRFPIRPTIELTVNNNKIDTVYVYTQK